MLPPKGHKLLPNKKFWKYSTAECEEAIIRHVKVPGDIEPTIKDQIEKAYSKKLSVQPYLIIEGSNLTKINKIYLNIDKIRYEFESARKAFDILFKTFQVLNANYPPQAEHLLQFIQQGVYNIATKNDKVFPSQNSLLKSVKDSL